MLTGPLQGRYAIENVLFCTVQAEDAASFRTVATILYWFLDCTYAISKLFIFV